MAVIFLWHSEVPQADISAIHTKKGITYLAQSNYIP